MVALEVVEVDGGLAHDPADRLGVEATGGSD